MGYTILSAPISLVPIELVQTLVVAHTHRMQKAFPQADC